MLLLRASAVCGLAFDRAHVEQAVAVCRELLPWFGGWCVDLAAGLRHITEVCLWHACGMPVH